MGSERQGQQALTVTPQKRLNLFTQNEIFEYHQSQEKQNSTRKEGLPPVKQFEEDKNEADVIPNTLLMD